MEVTITQFRRDIFNLFNQAADGVEVWVTYKGQRFTIAPEQPKRTKRSRPIKRNARSDNDPDVST